MSWIKIWKKSKKLYGWRHVQRACDQLATKYDYNLPTRIVALARGGLIPATIMANQLGVRHIYSLGVSSYEQSISGEEYPGQVEMYQRIPTNIAKLKADETVLLIDDISDRGTTFDYATNYVKQVMGGQIVTMSLVIKPETKFIPTYYYAEVPQDCWVTFPWEKTVA